MLPRALTCQAATGSARPRTTTDARLTFDHVVNDRLQEMIDTNFKFYKQVTDDPEFAQFFLGFLFKRYYERKGKEQAS
jgi:type I restriction enzyme R subunit